MEEPGEWKWDNSYRAQSLYHSIPYPSLARWERGTQQAPWATAHPRPLLVAAAFAVRGVGFSFRLRTSLHERCRADSRCSHIATPGEQRGGTSERSGGRGLVAAADAAEPALLRIARLYWSATFCLQV